MNNMTLEETLNMAKKINKFDKTDDEWEYSGTTKGIRIVLKNDSFWTVAMYRVSAFDGEKEIANYLEALNPDADSKNYFKIEKEYSRAKLSYYKTRKLAGKNTI
ncbi:MAG: hypothetical protein ACP5N2_03120 [Candidatus Nanoarchaeia archaeon]